MQAFFSMVRNSPKGEWSRKRFERVVTDRMHAFPGVKMVEGLTEARNPDNETVLLDMYLALVPIKNRKDGITKYRLIRGYCQDIHKNCRPYFFRVRHKDAVLAELNRIGLTSKEMEIFKKIEPSGEFRTMCV